MSFLQQSPDHRYGVAPPTAEPSFRTPPQNIEVEQALLGAWPFKAVDQEFTERIQAYALKAAREGKEETSWLNPNEPYEAGMGTFIARILDRSVSAEFRASPRSVRNDCAEAMGNLTVDRTTW